MKQTLQVAFSLFCLLPLALAAAAQTEDQVRDVQKLYKTAKVPGLEVTIYLQEENGSLTPIEPQHEFHQGEQVKIRIESNFRGYLYIVNHGTTGKKTLVFPDSEESNLIQPGASYLLPNTYGLVFDENAGFETLQVIVSRQRLPLLDAALKQTEAKLNKSQITAIARFWNKPASEQAGITSGDTSAQSGGQSGVLAQSRDLAFDKKSKTTTVLNAPQKKTGRQKTANPPTSIGIRLNNTGKPPAKSR